MQLGDELQPETRHLLPGGISVDGSFAAAWPATWANSARQVQLELGQVRSCQEAFHSGRVERDFGTADFVK